MESRMDGRRTFGVNIFEKRDDSKDGPLRLARTKGCLNRLNLSSHLVVSKAQWCLQPKSMISVTVKAFVMFQPSDHTPKTGKRPVRPNDNRHGSPY
ncbi:hypothetical protein FRC02_006370 [Tulasnella sp. 418]|nr:hypothetical protein FRC02_006370 [Tulasnella sp. 418]